MRRPSARKARAVTRRRSFASRSSKSAIVANPVDFPQGSPQRRELIEWYADCVAPYAEYIPGPDMGTDERDMDIIFERNARSIGRTDGIPLDQLGLTALGVMHTLKLLVEGGFVDGLTSVAGSTMSVEGFGNVGAALARWPGASVIEPPAVLGGARPYRADRPAQGEPPA